MTPLVDVVMVILISDADRSFAVGEHFLRATPVIKEAVGERQIRP